MNRLSPLAQKVPLHVPAASDSSVALGSGTLERQMRHATPHALFVPMHYEPNYGYPLLVWLHGPGDDERQLQRVMPLISLRNYMAVAPRGLLPTAGCGFTWRQEEADIDRAEARVFEAIDLVAQRYHVARQRIFVGGFSHGGTMALRIGLRHPEVFAGAVSLVGPFPSGHAPLARLSRARQLPLLLAQGRDAKIYSIDRSCAELRLFHAAGMSVTLRQYPCGDELTTHMLADMDRWMMEQVTGVHTEPEIPPVDDCN